MQPLSFTGKQIPRGCGVKTRIRRRQGKGRVIRGAETGNVLRNLQQSLDETIGHPRRNTGYAGSNNSSACCLLSPTLRLSLSLSLSRFLTLFPFDYPCCIFFSVFRSLSIYSPVTASPTFSLVSYRLPFPTALFVSTAIEDNVVGRGENNIDVTEASVYCDDSTMNFCRIGGAMSLRARTWDP